MRKYVVYRCHKRYVLNYVCLYVCLPTCFILRNRKQIINDDCFFFSIGKLYAVFGKRQGRVISAENAYGFGGQFRVLATLPVMESFHLARELRTQTSGLASPQLVFSHWEVNTFSYLAINISHHIIYYEKIYGSFFCFV